MASVMDVLREDIVGLVKTREAALEPCDKALEIPRPVGDVANLSIAFRHGSKGFRSSFESNSDSSEGSVNRRNVSGLICGGAIIPLPLLSPRPRRKSGMSVSDIFLV